MSVASSRDIIWQRRSQDGPAADPVLASFDRVPAHHIDVVTQQRLESFLHRDEVDERPPSVWVECHEDVDVAITAKIVTKNRA